MPFQRAEAEREGAPKPFSNRRVILQRKTPNDPKSVFARIEVKSEVAAGGTGAAAAHALFSRAVRTLAAPPAAPAAAHVEYESASEDEQPPPALAVAAVANLPHGMTDTRLATLAGLDVQVNGLRGTAIWIGARGLPFYI